MENSTVKLMPPVFNNDGMFNRENKRIRAQYLKDITNGTDTFSLWHKAGQPDNDYPRADNDKYYLYVEIGGYLVPTGRTECTMIGRIGDRAIIATKYNGNAQNRASKIDAIRAEKGYDGVEEFLKAERQEVNSLGSDESKQTDLVKAIIQEHIDVWEKSKQSNGHSFPDFVGAVALNELDKCLELREEYNKVLEQRRKEEAEQRKARLEAEHDQQNRAAQEQVNSAISAILNGGTLENSSIDWSPAPGESKTTTIINYLLNKYNITVPLRTRGWIIGRLASVTFTKDGGVSYRYWKSRNGRGSQSVYTCLFDLVKAVKAEQQQIQDAEIA